ncbi:flagellar protein FlaG [Catenovulum adriaticum]|uniref:Flagellar protein FlaG n=1 Tax=Catenovulum adriaticum TaxID=2984846 RepID=A0ABY7ARQ0_9ALTE|nr:flagellar protein FlaG [Catenovulum sp. TS8]WAJ71029.1 flagellar protein FlaG [Catenovulum sp. TS8]
MDIQTTQIGNQIASNYADGSQLIQNKVNNLDEGADSNQKKSDLLAGDLGSQKNVVNISAEQNKLAEQAKVSALNADNLIDAEQNQIETALDEVTTFVQTQNRQLNFSFDEQSNRSIIKVTDSDSGEMIRQIPSEDVLKLAQRIKELQTDAGEAIGVLINRQV